MGEFWIDSGPGQGVRVDNKVASSIAHVAGKKVVASESYTASPSAAKWQNHPFSLKPEGDRAFCAGVNQFVFHTFSHQTYPVTGPGFTFFYWGLNFNRGNTWWDAADAWMNYLTRCNHILRQGQQVCDVLWFVGEDVPNRIAWRDELKPVLPDGYDFDGCDATALLSARVRDGKIILPSGAEYRVLLLPDLLTMRPAVAKKVRELVKAGATVVAPRRPTQSPSLRDRGSGDAVVREAVTAWEKGRVFEKESFEEVFRQIGLTADFEYRPAEKDAEVLYVHRRVGASEVYFLSNQRNRFEEIEATFRVGTKAPELWDPSTGKIVRPGVYRQGKSAYVTVPLRLDPNGSVFVVFRDAPGAVHVVSVESGSPAAPKKVSAPVPTEGLKTAAGNFTLAVTVKPGVEIPLPAERKAEVAFQGQNWAVFPAQGQQQFGDGHAGVGIAAGRNGIVVFEHSARYAPAVVTLPVDLKDGAHVAVVYRNGVPTLFVNGQEKRSGTKGPHTIHAVLAGGHPFKGERSAPMLFDRALSAAEIVALANVKPASAVEPPAVEVERDADGTLKARLWKRGTCEAMLADGKGAVLQAPSLPEPVVVGGAWEVSFPPGLGAPASARFDKLISWPEHSDPGIRYFSGTATYNKELNLPESLFGGNRELYLDLGSVEVIARVTLNGQELPTLWKPPFRVRIDGVARPGPNKLEVRVTNLWPNRMIGDAALPDDIEWQTAKGSALPLRWPDWLVQGKPRPSGRIAFCTRGNVYSQKDPLLPSGLIGPVMVRVAERIPVVASEIGALPGVKAVMEHIQKGFPQSVKSLKEDKGDVVGLPHPYTSPCVKDGFQQLFYWDTFFINQGLQRIGMEQQARYNTDNLLFLLDKFGLVPNANRISMANRSQIPFLSQMVRDVYERTHDDAWLRSAYTTLKKEYEFWMTRRVSPVGLNRSGNEATKQYLLNFYNYLAKERFKGIACATEEEKLAFARQALSEAETWDFTPRFDRRAEEFCAVDLNSNLYVYETNFAWFSRILKNGEEKNWLAKAARRKELIQKLLWNEKVGCYTDYDWKNRQQGDLVSCATLFPLLAGIATAQQAEQVVRKMREVLEYDGGLATCEKRTHRFVYQWDYPNAWPPMQWVGIQALDRYGYKQDARRIAGKYVQTVTRNFQKTGDLWEKYNAITGAIDVADEYQMPKMMGWTAGVFVRAVECLDATKPALNSSR
jgi:neutral trehalase